MGKKRSLQENFIDTNTYQAIFESATEGIIVTDTRGHVLVANKVAHSIFGYRKGEMRGMTIEDFVPEYLRKKHVRFRKSFHKLPKPRKMGEGRDLLGVKKNGDIFPIEVSLSHSEINGQQIAIAFIIDITVRKTAEEQLRKEKETTQMYLDVAGSIFLVIDTKKHIRLINRKGTDVLGFKEEKKLIGRSWLDFVEQSDKKRVRSLLNGCLSGKQPLTSAFESKITAKSGNDLLIYWQTAAIKNDQGKPIACLFSGIDITDRKKAEEAVRKSEEKLIMYAAELEKRVQKRTTQLADTVNNLETINKELEREVAERKKAEEEARVTLEKQKELNDLKSRFVSMASHEFRTPLSTILSSAALIGKYEKEDMVDKRLKHINRIRDNVNDLTGILNDFLSLEKLEGGRIHLNPERIEMVSFIHALTDELKSICKTGQTIHFSCNSGEYEIKTDRVMLKNILNNLISNAIKYSPEGSEIEVVARTNRKNVTIKVVDAGIGIPEEDQKHLFTRFFRAKNAINIQGTGLGLNLVKRYLDLSGGKLWFESQEGKGSTFYITIPRITKEYEKNSFD